MPERTSRATASICPQRWHAEFDDFCKLFRRNFDPESLLIRMDPESVDEWSEQVLKPGRHRGLWDLQVRLSEMERAGVAAEVLFPDFGRPFELPLLLARKRGYHRTPEQIEVGNQAYNRWLVDFCSEAPERFVPLAAVSFHDVDAVLKDIRWAKDAGFRGILLPTFTEEHPIFDECYNSIWEALVELEMIANSHIGITATIEYAFDLPAGWHPALGVQVTSAVNGFFCQQVLSHLIWGGVLERFPSYKLSLPSRDQDG